MRQLARCLLLGSFLTIVPRLAPAAAPTTAPATALATTAPGASDYLLHLPGIAGAKSIDRAVTRGIRDGGFTGTVDIYDWTEHDPGLDALVARDRNTREARHVADILVHQVAVHRQGVVDLLCHSGGGGIAIWALEDLPPGVQIHDVIFMSPAVSPGYNLSRALSHVEGNAYVFCSLADLLVLGTGTRWFGTIDGIKTDAAGRVGFVRPTTGDPRQYAKLVQIPYDTSWTQYGNFGDHRGGMSRSFGQNILAPLLLCGTPPPTTAPFLVETPTGLGRSTTQPVAPGG